MKRWFSAILCLALFIGLFSAANLTVTVKELHPNPGTLIFIPTKAATYQVRCTVTDQTGQSVTTRAATVTIGDPPATTL